jgi:hypothetical protein
MASITRDPDTMPSLERALWAAYGRALEADCFETARDLMDAIMALQQRRMLLEPGPAVLDQSWVLGSRA